MLLIYKGIQMAEFVIHGIVNGQEVSKSSESARAFCEGFYVPNKGIKHDIRRLVGNRMAYSYVIYEEPGRPFLGYTGRSGSYFGMTLIFQDKQVSNPDILFKVLQTTYDKYVKDKVIQETSGNRKWLCTTLNDSKDTVAGYIGKGLENILKSNPGIIKYQPLPPMPQQARNY